MTLPPAVHRHGLTGWFNPLVCRSQVDYLLTSLRSFTFFCRKSETEAGVEIGPADSVSLSLDVSVSGAAISSKRPPRRGTPTGQGGPAVSLAGVFIGRACSPRLLGASVPWLCIVPWFFHATW